VHQVGFIYKKKKKISPLYLQRNFYRVSSTTRLNNKTANTRKVITLQSVRH